MSQSSQTHPMQLNDSRKFLWSLKPLITLMCLFGIPIIPSVEVSSYCRLASIHLFRIFCFLAIILIYSSQSIHTIYNAKDVSMAYLGGLSSSALAWNFIIDSLDLAFYVVGSHISLLLLTRSKTWPDLINAFKLLEENVPLFDTFFVCRKLAVKIIIYIIVSVTGVTALLGIELIFNENTVMRKIIELFAFFAKIYPAMHLALFCILTRFISLLLKNIRKRIDNSLIQCKESSLKSVVKAQRSQLAVLRGHHRLICKAIRKLNRYFGVFLTIEVGYIFVYSIISSLYITMSGINFDGLLGILNILVWIDGFVHLFLLTSFSDDIVKQTDNVYEALLQLLNQEPSLQNEVSLFTEQLMHMRSHISAFGFFEVEKRLFLSLIGTTLTYFLILLQFHSAEKA